MDRKLSIDLHEGVSDAFSVLKTTYPTKFLTTNRQVADVLQMCELRPECHTLLPGTPIRRYLFIYNFCSEVGSHSFVTSAQRSNFVRFLLRLLFRIRTSQLSYSHSGAVVSEIGSSFKTNFVTFSCCHHLIAGEVSCYSANEFSIEYVETGLELHNEVRLELFCSLNRGRNCNLTLW